MFRPEPRIRAGIQPIQAVSQSWSLEDDQAEAVLAHVVRRCFDSAMDTPEGQDSAPAVAPQ